MKKLIPLLFLLIATMAWTQTEQPQPYKPIPSYSGVNAGQLFLNDLNGKLSGADVTSPSLVKLYTNNLPVEKNGLMYYAIDGVPGSSPCTGGGGGAVATGVGGVWVCTAAPGGGGGSTTAAVWNPWKTSINENLGPGNTTAGPYTLQLANGAVIPGVGAAQPVSLYVNGVLQGSDPWGAGQITGPGIVGACNIRYQTGAITACTFTAAVPATIQIMASYTYAIPPPYNLTGYNGQTEGLQNIKAWGAIGSGQAAQCTGAVNSNQLTGCGTIPPNIRVGQYVSVLSAGPATSISWPAPPASAPVNTTTGSSTLTFQTAQNIPKGQPVSVSGGGTIAGTPFTSYTTAACVNCTTVSLQGQLQQTQTGFTATATFGPTASPKTWIKPGAVNGTTWYPPINSAQGAANDYGGYEGCTVDKAGSVPAFINNNAYNVGDEVGATISITDPNGQTNTATGIFIVVVAGTSASSGTPTWPVKFGGNVTSGGAKFSLQGLAPAGATYGNTACNVVYGFKLYPIDHDGSWGTPSSTFYVTHSAIQNSDGPAVLGPDNRILLQWLDAPGAYGVGLTYCTGTGCTPSTTINATINARWDGLTNWYWFMSPANDGSDPASGTSVPSTIPSAANVDGIYVTNIAGGTITLSGTLSQSGSFYVRSDDWPAAQAAVSWACAQNTGNIPGTTTPFNAGTPPVYLPANAGWLFSQPLQLHGCAGLHLYGAGGNNSTYSNATNINYIGPPGGVVIDANDTAGDQIDNFNILYSVGNFPYASMPGISLDIDRYGYVPVSPTGLDVHNIAIGTSGAFQSSIDRMNPSGGGDSMNFHDVLLGCPYNGTPSEVAVNLGGYFAGGAISVAEKFENVYTNCASIAYEAYFAGDLTIEHGFGANLSGGGGPQLWGLGQAKSFKMTDIHAEQGGKLMEWYSATNGFIAALDHIFYATAASGNNLPSSGWIITAAAGSAGSSAVHLNNMQVDMIGSFPVYPMFIYGGNSGNAQGYPNGLSVKSNFGNSDPFAQALVPSGYNQFDELADTWNDSAGISHNSSAFNDVTRLRVNANTGNGTDNISGTNAIMQDAVNPLAYGVKADPRGELYNPTPTCTINNASPGTITGCSTLNPTAADNGKLIRVVSQAGPNLFTGCVLSGGTTTTLGTLVGGVCTAAAYTGTTTANVFVQIGTDDRAAMQSVIDSKYSTLNNLTTGLRIQLPNRCVMISDTLKFNNKSGEFRGHGMLADGLTQEAQPGSCIIWAGPRGHPVLQVTGTYGIHMDGFALFGNSNPNNKPSAMIDLVAPSASPAYRVPDGANTFSNIAMNDFAGNDVDTGGAAGTATAMLPTSATYGIEWDYFFNGSMARDVVQHVGINQTDACFANLVSASAAAEIDESACGSSGVGVVNAQGSEMNLNTDQFLNINQKFIVGGGSKTRVHGLTQSTGNAPYGNLAFANQEIEFLVNGAYMTFVGGSVGDPDWNIPDSGVFIDGSGEGITPGWPGPSTSVQQNQLIQPPISYQGWTANAFVFGSNTPPWYASSPFPPNYVILPANNDATGNYFRVLANLTSGSTGPGITGTVEPNWSTIAVGATMFDSANGGSSTSNFTCGTGGVCGIQWQNIGTVLPTRTIVPTTGNPGGFAFRVQVGGKTGATQPTAWNQTVGGTQVDNTVTWVNIGVLTTNPNLWQFKETAAGPCTTGASMPVLNQTLNGTTTDGTCTWTTTLAGQNGSLVNLAMKDSQIATPTTPNQSPVLLFDPQVVGGAGPTIYANFDNVAGLAAGMAEGFPASPIPTLISYDGGLSNSWSRQLIIGRKGSTAEQGQNDLERLQPHTVADMQHYDLAGKVTLAGQTIFGQLAQPIAYGPLCNVPVWAANTSIPANWAIKPPTAVNTLNHFFQNQGAACVTGGTQPTWPQTAGNTVADGTCTETDVGDGTGVASATLAGKYYIKYTWRVGLPVTPQLETNPNTTEQVSQCAPTSAPNVNISLVSNATIPAGTDSVGIYESLATGTEALAFVIPFGVDTTQGAIRWPVSAPVPPDWVATTVYQTYTLIKPGTGNAGGYIYMATIGGVSGGTRPGTFNQTVGGTTTDGSQKWINVGLGVLPTVNNTGIPQWGMPNVALGGGSAPTLGTIGGSGPATAAQNSWIQIKDSTGASAWIPIWK